MATHGMTSLVVALCTAVGFIGTVLAAEPESRAMTIAIPDSMKAEHAELHSALEAAMRAEGRTGEAAKAVAQALHAHFAREEEIALPPLGLLEPLAAGRLDPAMRAVLPLTDQLRAELPQMLAEHKEVVARLDRLRQAAQAESRPEVVEFAEQLARHARTEEQVTYPAAILVGEYLKLKLR